MEVNQGGTIGVGLIGHGFMGRAHANAFLKAAYSLDPPPARGRLVAVAGRDAAGLAGMASRFGFAATYADWRDLIADPQVRLVDNVSSNDLHAEASIAALRAGRHVLCEKPMARNAEEARAMRDAAVEAGVRHMVGFNYRFVPAVRRAHELVLSGALGEVRNCRAVYLGEWLALAGDTPPRVWRLQRSVAGSGALGDLGSHALDLLRFLVGEPGAVMAMSRTFRRPTGAAEGEVDDAVGAVIEFRNGALGTFEASRLALGRKNFLAFELNGTLGSVRFDLERLNELEVSLRDGDASAAGGTTRVLVTEPSHPLRGMWPKGHIVGWEDTFVHEALHLLDAIANDRPVEPLGATFEDGYRNVVVMDAIQRSAAEGRRVDIAY
jgi:predicted dehydrogenase